MSGIWQRANGRFWRMSLKKSVLRETRGRFGFGRLILALSCRPELRSVRQELCKLPEVLGCRGEAELVSGAVRSA